MVENSFNGINFISSTFIQTGCDVLFDFGWSTKNWTKEEKNTQHNYYTERWHYFFFPVSNLFCYTQTSNRIHANEIDCNDTHIVKYMWKKIIKREGKKWSVRYRWFIAHFTYQFSCETPSSSSSLYFSRQKWRIDCSHHFYRTHLEWNELFKTKYERESISVNPHVLDSFVFCCSLLSIPRKEKLK